MVVQEGYDRVASSYLQARPCDGEDTALLAEVLHDLPSQSRVLDAGCGSGIPVAGQLLEAGHDVAGVDFSSGQLSLARSNLAKCRLVQGDLAYLPFSNGSMESFRTTQSSMCQEKSMRPCSERSIGFFDTTDERCCASDGVIFPRTAIPTAGSVFRCSGATSTRRRILYCSQRRASFLNGANGSPIRWGTLPINSYCPYAADPAMWGRPGAS
jgi:SAM-dependent methyltransferase